jgi:hypothetical protein
MHFGGVEVEILMGQPGRFKDLVDKPVLLVNCRPFMQSVLKN